MCPGLTSPGGRMEDVLANSVVVNHSFPACVTSSHNTWARVRVKAIFAEGKEHALAIGFTKLSSAEMYIRFLSSALHCAELISIFVFYVPPAER